MPPPLPIGDVPPRFGRIRFQMIRDNGHREAIAKTFLIIDTFLLLFLNFLLLGISRLRLDEGVAEYFLCIGWILNVFIVIGAVLQHQMMLKKLLLFLSIFIITVWFIILIGIITCVFFFLMDYDIITSNDKLIKCSVQWLCLVVLCIGMALQRMLVEQLLFDISQRSRRPTATLLNISISV